MLFEDPSRMIFPACALSVDICILKCKLKHSNWKNVLRNIFFIQIYSMGKTQLWGSTAVH